MPRRTPFHERTAALLHQSVAWVTVLTFPLFLCCFVLATPLTTWIFGTNYAVSGPILAALSIARAGAHATRLPRGFDSDQVAQLFDMAPRVGVEHAGDAVVGGNDDRGQAALGELEPGNGDAVVEGRRDGARFGAEGHQGHLLNEIEQADRRNDRPLGIVLEPAQDQPIE